MSRGFEESIELSRGESSFFQSHQDPILPKMFHNLLHKCASKRCNVALVLCEFGAVTHRGKVL